MFEQKSTFVYCSYLSLVLVLLSLLVPNFAFADDSTEIGKVMCRIIWQLQTGIGKGIATIAIIALGIGLFAGKLSWPVALTVALGIGLIFGAGSIVTWIAGSDPGNTGLGTGCIPN